MIWGTLMVFTGHLTFEEVNSLLAELPPDKRLYNILLECLQNIVHHGTGDSKTTIKITSIATGYLIQASNTILNRDVENLKAILERVNCLSQEELTELYLQTLTTRSFNTKGTAGLGLIGVARKSRQKLVHGFKKIDEQFSLIS